MGFSAHAQENTEAPAQKTFTFSGIEGLNVALDATKASYAAGVYTIADIPNTSYSSVTVSVPASLSSTVKLLGVTPDGGDMITPDSSGIVYVPTYDFLFDTHFTIVTADASAGSETISTTFTIMNGEGYMVTIYNVTAGELIGIYSNNPTEVEFEKGDAIFIGNATNDELYQILVDGEVVPASLCGDQEAYGGNYGYLLTENCGYYPTNGGSVQIYQHKPADTNFNISFSFTHPDTFGFVYTMKLGNEYVNLDQSEMEQYLAQGASVPEGSYFEMQFNTRAYEVESVTLNGQPLDISNGYYVCQAIDEDLAFVFNVKQLPGNKVTVVSKGWMLLYANDPFGHEYAITGETTVLELPLDVDAIRIMVTPEAAKAKWFITEGGIAVTPGDVKYSQGDGIPVENGMVINVPVENEKPGTPFPTPSTTGITITSSGWEHLNITDQDQKTYALTGTETVINFGSSVQYIVFKADEGYVIPAGGVVTVTSTGATTAYDGGAQVPIAGVSSISVTVNSDTPSTDTKTFFFSCSADVIDFTGGTAGTGNPARKDVQVNASYADGVYTVTDVPEYITLTVKQAFRDKYVLQSVSNASEGFILSYDNGISIDFPTARFDSKTEFTVNFKDEEQQPQYITIEVNDASYIKRVYSEGAGNIIQFPAKYDLNDGLLISVQAKDGAQIDAVAIDGKKFEYDYPAPTVIVDLKGVEAGATVSITASSIAAEFVYTFAGAEGLRISYRGMNAVYSDGIYTLNNISSDGLNNVMIAVAPGYENKLRLESVTDGTTTWLPTGAENIIYIPGSQLPLADTDFTVNTVTPDPSETVRTVYLTIDDVEVVEYGRYQGQSGYFVFNNEGVATLTISPTEFAVELVTTEPVTFIEASVENTLTLPSLPSSSFTLDLQKALEGETVNLFTEAIALGEAPVVSVDDEGNAIITVSYTVSSSLVGRELAVTVDGKEAPALTPSAREGSFTVEVARPADGESASVKIEVTAPHASDSVSVNVSFTGIHSVLAGDDNVEVFNLQGIRVTDLQNLRPGIYIVNGRKVMVGAN